MQKDMMSLVSKNTKEMSVARQPFESRFQKKSIERNINGNCSYVHATQS